MRNRVPIVILSATAITACSRWPGSVGMPPATSGASSLHSTASEYKRIYNFKGIPDGASPNGDLLYSNGVFYGSTYYGGSYGAGTVFRMTASGAERVIHSFHLSHSKQSIANPLGIALLNGMLYGTTVSGGAYSAGAAYRMTTDGDERILHSFGYGSDGRVPYSGLLLWNGTFYGEAGGGTFGLGTVYSMAPTGKERVICDLSSAVGAPTGGLIATNGRLYGTGLNGGSYNRGTVFSLTTACSLRVLHNFGASSDGTYPNAGVTALHGTLYGTTTTGGTYGGGILFSLSKSGSEHILHDFGSGVDGSGPNGALAVRDGVLYGTTQSGGEYGEGTFFSMTTSGVEETLHNFGHRSDGAQPSGALLLQSETLYGTTAYGGSVCNGAGCGTVFELTP
jgi:uncharacterized repeat protein (TIGR03803 family)